MPLAQYIPIRLLFPNYLKPQERVLVKRIKEIKYHHNTSSSSLSAHPSSSCNEVQTRINHDPIDEFHTFTFPCVETVKKGGKG